MNEDAPNPYHIHEWHLWTTSGSFGVYRCRCRLWASKDAWDDDFDVSDTDEDFTNRGKKITLKLRPR